MTMNGIAVVMVNFAGEEVSIEPLDSMQTPWAIKERLMVGDYLQHTPEDLPAVTFRVEERWFQWRSGQCRLLIRVRPLE